MFYSETLLSKTGPLARVWLSANLERKLSKTHILQTNIDSSVDAIVGQDQAPMALRLSGQLLLGVVRIYSRKARYLLEDCNEALMKIKMAFRPGNVDLPSGMTAHNSAQLILPDVITELDLLLPDPTLELEDLSLGDTLPLDSDKHRGRSNRITLADNDRYIGSQNNLLTLDSDQDLILQPDNLGLDIGDNDMSTIIGLDAPADKSYQHDLLSEMEYDFSREPAQKSLLEDDEDIGIDIGLGGDGDIGFDGAMGFDGPLEADTTAQPQGEDTEMLPAPEHEQTPALGPEGSPAPEAEGARSRSGSPLSSVRSSVVRDLPNESHYVDQPSRVGTEDAEAQITAPNARQPSTRKRKVVIDTVTEIKSKQIKGQQTDRTAIVKDMETLNRDPLALSLLSLTANGAMASLMFKPLNLAPELQTLLVPDFIRKCADLKRKREAGEVNGAGEEGRDARPSPSKMARLELGDEGDETVIPALEGMEHLDMPQDESILQIPQLEDGDMTLPSFGGIGDDTEQFQEQQRARDGSASPGPELLGFEHQDTAAYHHPQTQTISRETRAAVHILREQFSAPASASQPAPSAVTFQDLLPPATTTRSDAAKMFFEVLVLATKDAVKVSQRDGFGDIHVGPKKALWGSWAEELDEQQQEERKERELDQQEKEKEEELASRRKQEQRVSGAGGRRDVVVGTGRNGAAEVASAA